jgi:hypothetical protein
MNKKIRFDSSTAESSRCLICKSKHSDQINLLIAQNKTFGQIKKIMLLKDPEFIFSQDSLKRHKRSHIMQVILGGKKSGKPTPIQIQNMTEFLDIVIEKVFADVQSGKLIPTIQDAVKASEIKSKIKEDNKYTSDLKEFFMQVSNVTGNHR